MRQATSIMIPTDLTESTLPALEFALSIAAPLNASLDLLYVVDTRHDPLQSRPSSFEATSDEWQAEMKQQIAAARKSLGSGTNKETHVRYEVAVGSPWEEVVEAAQRQNSELIVMATHNRSRAKAWLVGSVTERVLRAASCPVLTIRTGDPLPTQAWHNESVPEVESSWITLKLPKHLLVPVDLTTGCLPALTYASILARAFSARITLLHVVDVGYATLPLLAEGASSVDLQQEMTERAYRRVGEFLGAHEDTLGERITAAPLEVRVGEVPVEIERFATSSDVDLVVIGRHGRRGFRRFLMGSVAEQVVRSAPCPVLTVPLSTP